MKFFQTYAFLNFVDEGEAMSFWQAGQTNQGAAGLYLRGRGVAVNWAKKTDIAHDILSAVRERGATRVV